MAKTTNRVHETFDELRRRAKELPASGDVEPPDLNHSASDVSDLIEELEVSHTELELQNEDLRHTQSRLAELHQRYSDPYEFAPVAYLQLDLDGTITSINLTGVSMLGRDRAMIESRAMSFFIHGDSFDVFRSTLSHALAHGSCEQAELRIAGEQAPPLWVKADIDPVKNRSGVTEGFRVTLTDVSRLKRAEEKARQASREKDLLMRELQHRTKNDIMLLASFLYLQAQDTQNQEAREALMAARERLTVIQKVYQRLYSQASLREIQVSGVVQSVLANCRQAATAHNVEVESAVTNAKMPTAVAVTVGIMVNELVTNAIRHADGENPRATVSLSLREEHTVRLVVADNGRGFPDRVVTNGGRGFGLRVVDGLAQTHGGSLELSNTGPDGGAQAVVTLRIPAEEA